VELPALQSRVADTAAAMRHVPDAAELERSIPSAGRLSAPWTARYARRLAVSDAIVILLAASLVHVVHVGTLKSRLTVTSAQVPFLGLTIGLVIAWLLALGWAGSRAPEVVGHGVDEYKRLVQATVALFGIAGIAAFLFDLDLPRSYVLVMMPVGLVALLGSRLMWRMWLRRRRDRGKYLSTVLAAGSPDAVNDLIDELRRFPRAGYVVVGACVAKDSSMLGFAVEDSGGPLTVGDVPILGTFSDIADLTAKYAIDTVAVTASPEFGPRAVRKLSWQLESSHTRLVLAPALTDIAGPRIHTQPIGGLPLIHVDRPTYRGANQALKKTFDLVGSAVLTIFLAPLLLAVALAIKITSPGPVFFRQERIGIDGNSFRMIKFRSMVADAEARLAALKARGHDRGNDVLFKMRDDPRVTKVGRFIRKFSIDELPQLFNVLFGHMSLVGPRPPLLSETENYEDDVHRRLLVKPGMTGLWQVSGRSDLSWEESVRLDLYYVENWSITGDIAIIWRTFRALTHGAY